MVEDEARRHSHDAASCSNRSVILNLSLGSSFALSDPLLPMWMSLIRFSSCCLSLSSSPGATACAPAICSSLPSSTSTPPAPLPTRALFLSFSRSLSEILCAFILAFPVKVLSITVLVRSRHSFLCGYVAFPCDARATQHPDNLQCDHEPRCLQTTRRIFSAQALEFFHLQSLAMVVQLLLCQMQLSLSTQDPPSANECHTSHPST